VEVEGGEEEAPAPVQVPGLGREPVQAPEAVQLPAVGSTGGKGDSHKLLLPDQQ